MKVFTARADAVSEEQAEVERLRGEFLDWVKSQPEETARLTELLDHVRPAAIALVSRALMMAVRHGDLQIDALRNVRTRAAR